MIRTEIISLRFIRYVFIASKNVSYTGSRNQIYFYFMQNFFFKCLRLTLFNKIYKFLFDHYKPI
jgi:hypothetical protein